MNAQKAAEIAVSGLQRLADDDDLLMRFCALTGILRNDLRQAAEEPHFLVGVLDFFLSHESDLLAWAEAENINPEHVIRARHALSPQEHGGFE